MTEDTLIALCTAQGKGALSVLRLSGPKALSIGRSVAGFLPEKPEAHKAYFGILKYRGRKLDEVLLTYFKKGHSFTGEETLEISCHGGGVYVDILESLIEEGARPAKRGEFSLQALSNGKIDLTQAEGLLQLIESENRIARREALKQLQGELSKRLLKIEEKWLFLLSHIEADIDFSMENLNTLTEDEIQNKIQNLLKELESLISSYQPFDKLQKGLVFGIFGSTNVGKSSLFNALLDQEKAIVSEEAGTTRDIVETQILNPKGLNLLLKDCAGFRESESQGEKKGQKKSLDLFKGCDYRLILIDVSHLESHFFTSDSSVSSDPYSSLDSSSSSNSSDNCAIPLRVGIQKVFKLLEKDLSSAFKTLSSGQKNWLVFTKTDLLSKNSLEAKKSFLEELSFSQHLKAEKVFFISSLTKEGLSGLKEQMLACGDRNQESFLITNSRHYEALKIMRDSLLKCQKTEKSNPTEIRNKQKGKERLNKQRENEQDYEEKTLSENISLDIIAFNLQEGLMALYEILGKQVDDKVLDQVFEKFCIGK